MFFRILHKGSFNNVQASWHSKHGTHCDLRSGTLYYKSITWHLPKKPKRRPIYDIISTTPGTWPGALWLETLDPSPKSSPSVDILLQKERDAYEQHNTIFNDVFKFSYSSNRFINAEIRYNINPNTTVYLSVFSFPLLVYIQIYNFWEG